jgi:enediyne biosynthesis protein E4
MLRTTPARCRRPVRWRRVLAALTGIIAITACTAERSASPGSNTPTGAGLELTVIADGRSARLGEAIDVTVTVRNSGTRSVSVPIELRLRTPAGDDDGVRRTTLFVPLGDAASERFPISTARWSADAGDFVLTVEVTDPALGELVATTTVVIMPADRVIPTFEDVTDAAGVMTDVPDPACGQFANGAAWGDVDGDGRPDLVVTRLGDPVQLFLNDGDGTFTESATARGIDVADANGASFADHDNDGDADLLLLRDGPNVLLANDGTGNFVDVTAAAGVAGDAGHRSMSAAWADVDGDGLLDLYVANYMGCSGPWTTEQEIIANVEYHPGVLYRNSGGGRFTDVTDSLPDAERTAAAFTAAWLDVDRDRRPDLYVANDFVGISPDHNRLWSNLGSDASPWEFADRSLESGTGLYMNTMGVGIGDVDRDGDDDLVLSNIGGNKLLRDQGDGTFVEDAQSGIERPFQDVDQATVTWGTVVADFDLDGWLDVFMAAGNLPQGPEAVVGEQPNMMFLNDGTGARFLDVSAVTGTDGVGESKGVAAADYDADGDIDLFVVDQGGDVHLYRNVTERSGRHWLALDLVGTTSNRDACGARVRVSAGGATQHRTVQCGSGGTGSGHARQVHVGLGDADTVTAIEVEWPSGIRQSLGQHAADQVIEIVEPE